MRLNNEQFLERLANLAEPAFLCEILNITSEDIIEQFNELVEENEAVLREVYDIDLEIEEDQFDGR
tara:strand:- start:329 stop:526 length:198 start_codon:yes stop_codon:yes gene_type:complete